MIHHRLVLGSVVLMAAVGCGPSPKSQAPSPIQSTTQTAGTAAGGAISSVPNPGLGVGTMAGCPGGNGIHISATGGTATGSSTSKATTDTSTARVSADSSAINQSIGLGQAIDTTWAFDIPQRTWTRTNLAAAISVGLADEVKGRYAICAGVNALIPNATLTLQGARGRVHFAASLKQLSDALRLGPGR